MGIGNLPPPTLMESGVLDAVKTMLSGLANVDVRLLDFSFSVSGIGRSLTVENPGTTASHTSVKLLQL
jgi:hypothetical protein